MGRKRSSQKQPIRPARKKLKPKTENQENYIISMAEQDVTFCSGPHAMRQPNRLSES